MLADECTEDKGINEKAKKRDVIKLKLKEFEGNKYAGNLDIIFDIQKKSKVYDYNKDKEKEFRRQGEEAMTQGLVMLDELAYARATDEYINIDGLYEKRMIKEVLKEVEFDKRSKDSVLMD